MSEWKVIYCCYSAKMSSFVMAALSFMGYIVLDYSLYHFQIQSYTNIHIHW